MEDDDARGKRRAELIDHLKNVYDTATGGAADRDAIEAVVDDLLPKAQHAAYAAARNALRQKAGDEDAHAETLFNEGRRLATASEYRTRANALREATAIIDDVERKRPEATLRAAQRIIRAMANETVTLSNPLPSADAQRLGISPIRDYNVGESLTVTDTIAGQLRSAGLVPASGAQAGTVVPREAYAPAPVVKTASYTLTASDGLIVTNGSSVTATLPSAVTAGAGRTYRVKNINASAATLASTAGTIDGAATKSLAQWAGARVISDGTNWLTI